MERPRTPQSMFTQIAKKYDTINTMLTLGGDSRARRHAVDSLKLKQDDRVLDIACGTGAIARALDHQYRTAIGYLGIDINDAMLEVAETNLQPIRATRPGQHWRVGYGDAEALDEIQDAQFDAAVIAFALDDFDSPQRALDEIYRVVRPDGRLVVLELALPEGGGKGLAVGFIRLVRLVSKAIRLAPVSHMTTEVEADRGSAATVERCAAQGFECIERETSVGGLIRTYLFLRTATHNSLNDI